METGKARSYPYDHTFGLDRKQAGERKTVIVIVITAIMMVVEIASGMIFGSVALLADGLHMGSHAVALGIAAFAYFYARKHATDRRFSFGVGKVNSLGGFTGALLLGVFALFMAWESVDRLINPVDITFNSAIFVAVIGLIVNGVSVLILGDNHSHDHNHDDNHAHAHGHHHHHDEKDHDHNLRSAYLHVMADALTSLTAIAALLCAKYFGWLWMDPVMGILGSILVATWSVSLIKETCKILLDHQAPESVTHPIEHAIEDDGESIITDMHVWTIAPKVMSVILSVETKGKQTPSDYRKRIEDERFAHVTIEVNPVK